MKLRTAIALAACNFSIPPKANGENEVWLQVTPAGKFKPSDGRQIDVPHWYIDAAVATKVIKRFSDSRNDRVVDYEHQTLHKEENGQPAPAAGWFRDLEWREGEGLFARVELTSRAAQYIADREYKYFSPVFMYDKKTGDVLDVRMGALTNFAGIDGMEELSLRAAATFRNDINDEEPQMKELLLALCAALGLAKTATEEEVVAALNAHLVSMRNALGLEDSATGETMVAACTGLKAKATAQSASSVDIKVVEQLKGQIAVLSAKLEQRDAKDVDTMIEAALEDGRLLKPMEAWARDLAKSDIAALTTYLDTAAPIAALSGSQSKGNPPKVDPESGLTQDEVAVCSAMGITQEQFKAAKEA